MTASYFTPALFSFLRQLKTHNTREWFHDHRDVYVRDVEAPMLHFIGDVAAGLARISPAFVADPKRHGGSMYRIYRDTRFSADKSPYKTHVAATFPHEQRKQQPSVPGFYLHLEPGDCLGGGGIYHPEMPALTRIRLEIANETRRWQVVRDSGVALEGDRLTRVPAGFDRAHPFVDDLRRKDFYALSRFTQKEVCAPDFLERYLASCEAVAPLVSFVTRALALRW